MRVGSEVTRRFATIEKLAVTASVKYLRNLLQRGTQEAFDKAVAAAARPGFIGPGTGGRTIGRLGHGGEGLVDSAIHPEYGLAARKAYDKGGLSSPEVIDRKMEFAETLRGTPEESLFAKTYGRSKTPAGTDVTWHELIRDNSPAPHAGTQTVKGWAKKQGIIDANTSKVRAIPTEVRKEVSKAIASPQDVIDKARAAGARHGYDLQDVRAANIVGGKVIDFLPARPGEFNPASGPLGNILNPTAAGEKWMTGSRSAADLSKGPSTDLEILKTMGPGSRQTKKIRGALPQSLLGATEATRPVPRVPKAAQSVVAPPPLTP